MRHRCERSTIEIPNDAAYRSLVGTYALGLARRRGAEEAVAERIRKAVEAALDVLLAFSFEDRERGRVDVTFEDAEGGLRIVLHDEGLPLDPGVAGPVEGDPASVCGTDGPCARLFAIRRWVDEVRFDQLGHRGKSITLQQSFGGEAAEAFTCPSEGAEDGGPLRPSLTGEEAGPIAVRAMQPSEAVAVARCIYRTYGYTYPHRDVYQPEKLAAMNREGALYSAVALDARDEVVGHCALRWSDAEAVVAEMVQGAVAPAYRSLGIFVRLTEHLMAEARRRGVRGVYARPVTLHDRSQRAGDRFGLVPCGLQLAMVPAETRFRSMTAEGGGRGSMLLQFRYLEPPGETRIHAPRRHREMIERLYRALGAGGVLPGRPGPAPAARPPAFRVRIVEPLGYGCIEVTAHGEGTVSSVGARLRELCLQRIDVIHLQLDLSDPQTPDTAEACERLGFFFSGILPGAVQGRDALILQYLNNVAVDRAAVHTRSAIAGELADYVFEQQRRVPTLPEK